MKTGLDKDYDLAIIGAGINGCGIAADAASRGLSVFLCDKDDIASHTSSSSSKLIHGGLRYLEYYDFALVKKALKEREILQNVASHLVKPLQIIIPQTPHMRNAVLIRLGLFLYDHLNLNNSLPKSRLISKKSSPELFSLLHSKFKKGFSYYDCSTDDARLTLSNALQAHHYGADINNYTECIAAEFKNDRWHLKLQSQNHTINEVKARVVINATGPFAASTNARLGLHSNKSLKLVKGSHLVLKQQFVGHQAYLLQHRDKRVIFVMPYCGLTMIGTTDIAYEGTMSHVNIDPREIDYLLAVANDYFKTPVSYQDIVSSWSGVRPLIDDTKSNPSALSRDFDISYLNLPGPALIVWGGKITTYRQLAKDAVNLLHDVLPSLSPSRTKKLLLPGAVKKDLWTSYQCNAQIRYAWLPKPLFTRLINSYGCRIDLLLANCHSLADLGEDLGGGLTSHEVDFLINTEWANTAEDILWRRTKLAYQFNPQLLKRLNDYLSKAVLKHSATIYRTPC